MHDASQKKPFVSVLLCVHNGEPYISDSIDSILQQTFKDFELLVIDDGSQDRTYAILEEFAKKDTRVRVVHQKNAGLTSALNTGISLCRGKWIARQDADDISLPQRLEKQVQHIRAHKNIGLLGTAYDIINVAGNVLPRHEVPLYTSHHDLCLELQCRNPFVHSSVMIKRETIQSLGGYRDAYPAAEDYECWLRMSKVTRLEQLPAKLVQRRISPQMICKQKAKTQRKSVLQAKWHHGVFHTFRLKVWFFILRDVCRIGIA